MMVNNHSIICATRGGPASRLSTQRAIKRAHRTGARLVFLNVMNQRVDEILDNELQWALQEEEEWLARGMLNLWKGRAENAGIHASICIRKGEVVPEIIACMQEESAEILYIGAPRGTNTHIFGDDRIEQIALEIQQETNIPVEIVRPEDKE